MLHEDQVAMIHRLLRHINDGTTSYAETTAANPVSSYTCTERLAQERQHLFRDRPLFLGLSARVKEPGDFFTEDVAGMPVLVTRDRDGRVRAFLNVCSHRGAPVAEGAGHASRFTCRYHAWTYGLDGALRGVPDARSFEGLDKSCNGLTELPSAEIAGLLFVVPATDPANAPAIDTANHLHGLEKDLGTFGFGNFHHYRSLTIERRMNWKLSPETFMEGYHLQYLHSASVGPIFYSNLMLLDEFGPHSRLTLPRRRITDLADRPESEWDLVPETAIIYTLFPNVTMVSQAGHVEMWRSYPHPTDPARCRVEVSVFTPNAVETEKAKRFYEKNIDLAILTVDGEDFTLSEKIQAGHAARAHESLVYGRNEPALIHYHRSLRAALAA